MASRGHRSPPKRKGQGGERREEILAAALRLFSEHGVYAVSTRQIAEAVGVSQPALYAHFASKDEIGRELHGRAFAELARRLEERRREAIDTPEQFARMVRVFIDFGLEQPDMYRMAFMAEELAARGGVALTPPAAAAYAILNRTIAELLERGLLIERHPAVLSQILLAGMHGLVSLLIAKPEFGWAPRETLIAAHADLLTRAVWRIA